MDSSLSRVPPVWPSPLPESLATARPSDAASGTKARVTPSATPPVECLSTVGRDSPVSATVRPDSTMALVRANVSPGSSPRMNAAIRNAAAW